MVYSTVVCILLLNVDYMIKLLTRDWNKSNMKLNMYLYQFDRTIMNDMTIPSQLTKY